jgi:hypothetical protein
MKLVWWKLNVKFHAVYPSWDGPAVVCQLFLYLHHMYTNNCIHLIVKIVYIKTVSCRRLSPKCQHSLSAVTYLSRWAAPSPIYRRFLFQDTPLTEYNLGVQCTKNRVVRVLYIMCDKNLCRTQVELVPKIYFAS